MQKMEPHFVILTHIYLERYARIVKYVMAIAIISGYFFPRGQHRCQKYQQPNHISSFQNPLKRRFRLILDLKGFRTDRNTLHTPLTHLSHGHITLSHAMSRFSRLLCDRATTLSCFRCPKYWTDTDTMQ